MIVEDGGVDEEERIDAEGELALIEMAEEEEGGGFFVGGPIVRPDGMFEVGVDGFEVDALHGGHGLGGFRRRGCRVDELGRRDGSDGGG